MEYLQGKVGAVCLKHKGFWLRKWKPKIAETTAKYLRQSDNLNEYCGWRSECYVSCFHTANIDRMT